MSLACGLPAPGVEYELNYSQVSVLTLHNAAGAGLLCIILCTINF